MGVSGHPVSQAMPEPLAEDKPWCHCGLWGGLLTWAQKQLTGVGAGVVSSVAALSNYSKPFLMSRVSFFKKKNFSNYVSNNCFMPKTFNEKQRSIPRSPYYFITSDSPHGILVSLSPACESYRDTCPPVSQQCSLCAVTVTKFSARLGSEGQTHLEAGSLP